mgnify:FL=1
MMTSSGVGFGTSGARGLVSQMTDLVCYSYTYAFLAYCEKNYPSEKAVAIAGDLRPSTGRILRAIATAAEDSGWKVIYSGRIPSPAIALYGIEKSLPTIMVTGSHIPADRNGIKFNHPKGEISKKDESGIRSESFELDASKFGDDGMLKNPVELPLENPEARESYKLRYLDFFGGNSLSGLTVGMYQHSAVGRDIITEILKKLGAFVVVLGRSEVFVPVDTEAVRLEDVKLGAEWAKQGLDAIVSTDGDSDRPLFADATGRWIRGDVLGILAAKVLGIERIATPVSCNTALEKCGLFEQTLRTRIGSPYVIAGMQELERDGKTVAGYEANGGFLLETDIYLDGKVLKALPTRDALLPQIAVLAAARAQKLGVEDLFKSLPKRFTASDRVKEFPTEKSRAKVAEIAERNLGETYFGKLAGKIVSTDMTDGYRMTFDNGDIIHLRPSGNAPELRCYVECDSAARAEELKGKVLAVMQEWKNA